MDISVQIELLFMMFLLALAFSLTGNLPVDTLPIPRL